MPFSGAGSFSPYVPGNPVVTGTSISSVAFNNTIQDIANGLSNAVTRDGQSPPSADLPMSSHKLTGLAAGTGAGDSVRFEQVGAVALTQGIAASGANGDITSMTGNLTGIKFAPSQVPSADVNTLDDYEEGTWNPVITAQTGSISSYTSAGRYTKIGRFVSLQLDITIVNAGTAGLAGQISNLPFSVSGTPAAAHGAGRDQTGGKMLNFWAVSSTVINVSDYNNGTALLTSANLVGTVTYYSA